MIPELDKTDPTITAAERTYNAILRRILNGEFTPGTRLTRRPLAEMLGVSHIPVLEALKRLTQDGLVEYRAHYGSFVTIPTAQRIRDVFVLREAIESQVFRILAENLNEGDEARLRTLAFELDDLPKASDDKYAYTQKHYQFHMELARTARSEALFNALEKGSFMWLLCLQGQSSKTRRPDSYDRHILLMDALHTRDVERSDATIRDHIRYGLQGVLQDYSRSGGEVHGSAPESASDLN